MVENDVIMQLIYMLADNDVLHGNTIYNKKSQGVGSGDLGGPELKRQVFFPDATYPPLR